MLAHILEHVDDPQAVLAVARPSWRPVGVKLGMLREVTGLHAGDLSIGHQRVYTPETFRAEIEGAELRRSSLRADGRARWRRYDGYDHWPGLSRSIT